VADAAASPSQDVPLFTLSANGSVDDIRVATVVACVNGAGTAQLTSVGLTGDMDYYATGLTYDLEAAVSDTNLLYPTLSARGSTTVAAIGVYSTVTSGTGNVDGWTDGCSFKVNVRWGTTE
jgi:hypothetical protein